MSRRHIIYCGDKTCPPCVHIWKTQGAKIQAECPDHIEKIMLSDFPFIAIQYHVKKTPTWLFIDENGKEYGRIIGQCKLPLGNVVKWLKGQIDDVREGR